MVNLSYKLMGICSMLEGLLVILSYNLANLLFKIQCQRLLGKKVIFITGTDEHGEKIATAAATQGSTPSEHCDIISEAYKTLWKDVVQTHPRIFLSVCCI